VTRTFSTPYPSQTIELAAGATKELPITFRPTESIPYSDQIRLTTKDAEYVISLQVKKSRILKFSKKLVFEVSEKSSF